MKLANAVFLCPMNGPVSPHMQLHTPTDPHTHPDNNNDDGDMSRLVFRTVMCVLSGTHFKRKPVLAFLLIPSVN